MTPPPERLGTTPHRTRLAAASEAHRVTPAELFFDLVFVYAITQVTALLADEPTVLGLAQGLVLLYLLWWVWCCFAWLGNVVRADTGALRLILLAVMALMLVIAVTVPEAYEDLPGGLYGPVVLITAYTAIRILHLTIYWLSDPRDRGLHRVLLRSFASLLPSLALLYVGAGLDGAAQVLVWAVALVADGIGIYLTGPEGWRIASPAHWAERHGLIVIIALGESIVAIGIGVADLPVSTPLIAGIVLGIVVSAALWWLYFDWLQARAEHRLAQLEGNARTALGRDAYTYLHIPLIAGVVVAAFGLKKVLEYVSDTSDHELTDALSGVPAWALGGGPGLYLLGTAAFAWRTTSQLPMDRVVVGAALLVAGPLIAQTPALAALAGVALLLAGLVAWEAVTRRPVPATTAN